MNDQRGLWNRRKFLKSLGAAFGGAALSEGLIGCAIDALAPTGAALVPLDSDFTWGVGATRPSDLLAINFEFANLALDSTKTSLVRTGTGAAAIALVLPPQHLLEAALGDVSVEPLANVTPLPVLAAGATRLVFLVPPIVDRPIKIPYSIRGLLAACAQYPLSVEPNAQEGTGATVTAARVATPLVVAPEHAARAAVRFHRDRRLGERLRRAPRDAVAKLAGTLVRGVPRAPTSGESGVEILTRLLVSPNEAARFQHGTDPFTSPWSLRTEMWRTRLATAFSDGRVLDAARTHTTVRAVWSRDPSFNPSVPPPAPVLAPGRNTINGAPDDTALGGSMLQPSHRAAIVHQSSNWTNAPLPIDVDELSLGALGGTLRADASWPNAPMLNWRHRSSFGRDQYVLAASRGYLLPYGHRATRVAIAERYFTDRGTWSYLRRFDVLIVDQPICVVDPAIRAHPFAAVEIVAKESPRLVSLACVENGNPAWTDPTNPLTCDGTHGTLYWPIVASTGEALRLAAKGTDKDGQIISFALPVAFVDRLDATDIRPINAYNAADEELRTLDVAGQRVAFVPSAVHATALETRALVLWLDGARPPDAFAPTAPRALRANVVLEAARHLAATTDDAPAVDARYAAAYVASGFPGDPGNTTNANPNEVFLELAAPVPLAPGKSDRSFGLVQPSLSVSGLSRRVGTVGGDVAAFAAGGFDPAAFFQGGLPNLFGVIKLSDIVAKLDAGAALQSLGASLVPKCVTESLDAIERVIAEAQRFQQRLQYDPASAQIAYFQTTGATARLADPYISDVNLALRQVAIDLGAVVTTLGRGDLDALTGVAGFLANPSAPVAPGSPLGVVRADLALLLSKLDVLAKAAPGLPIRAGAIYREVAALAASLQQKLQSLENVVEAAQALRAGLEAPKDLAVHLECRPPLQAAGPFTPNDPNGLVLSLEARAKAKKDPITGTVRPQGVDLVCALENFSLSFPAVSLLFERVLFTQLAGKKPEVDVVFAGLNFFGDLKLVEELIKALPFDGLSDPPYVDVLSDRVEAGFTFSVPNLAMGAFALRNVKVAAGVTVPFFGGISWRFDFCTKDEPFNLTIALLGGGGYLMLGGDASGVQTLEASIECGAYAALDLGVAQGEASLSLGAYLHLAAGAPIFGGFLHLRGAMTVLGLVGIAVEMRADLSYDSGTQLVTADASVSVELEVGPFHKSVSVSYSTSFSVGGGTSGARVVHLPTPSAYEGYLAAFAA